MSKISERITSGGNTILNGTVDPAVGVGSNGDFYINTDNNTMFGPKTAGVWGPATSLVAGTTLDILSGTLDPTPGEGLNGQYYINTIDNTLFGPKTGGAWGNAQPMAGIGTLITGTADPTNGIGNDGDFYTNTDTNTLFGPKVGGTWPSGVSLLGPFGGSAPLVFNSGSTAVIADGDTNPDLSDGTYKDAYQSFDEVFTFAMQNAGPVTLSAINVTLSNPDYTLTTAPATSLGSFGSTTFTITSNVSTLGTSDCTVTVNNDSAGTPAYSFLIRSEVVAVPTAIFVSKTGNDVNDGSTPGVPILTLTRMETLLDTMTVPVSKQIQVIFGPGEWVLSSDGGNITIGNSRWDDVTFIGEHLGVGQLDSSDVSSSSFITQNNFETKLGTTLEFDNNSLTATTGTNQARLHYKDIILVNSDSGNGSSIAGTTSMENVGVIDVKVMTSGSYSGNINSQVISIQHLYMWTSEVFDVFDVTDGDGTCTIDFDNIYVSNDYSYPTHIRLPGTMNNCTFYRQAGLRVDLVAGTLNIIDCLIDVNAGTGSAMTIGTEGGAGIVNILNTTINPVNSSYASIHTRSSIVVTDCILERKLDISKSTLPSISIVVNGTTTIGEVSGYSVTASGIGAIVDLTNWDNVETSDINATSGGQIDVPGPPTTGTYIPTYGSGPDANGSEIF